MIDISASSADHHTGHTDSGSVPALEPPQDYDHGQSDHGHSHHHHPGGHQDPDILFPIPATYLDQTGNINATNSSLPFLSYGSFPENAQQRRRPTQYVEDAFQGVFGVIIVVLMVFFLVGVVLQ
ncbi:hypothetical protein N7462_011631 [Penicillium macrosclerotiorum]|uniref:uncharacterized protein n=1 Tax=Penicillium macrosclerotiorum TaxID=303699 RepID=UPI0025496E84|nr:uncharacterized protein N7462_011631 [Penicillium macrosclerotiorum]KAJ5662705.1 hypothetical protein N7462_011631 [Penicillium macrosclerotiorum]